MAIEISKRSVILIIATIIGLFLAWRLQTLILSLLLAYIIVCGLNPMAIKIGNWLHLSYRYAAILVAGVVFIIFFASIKTFYSVFSQEWQLFIQSLPNLIDALVTKLQGIGVTVGSQQLGPLVATAINELIGNLAAATLRSVSIFWFVVTFVISTFYLLLNPNQVVDATAFIFPKQFKKIKKIEAKIQQRVGGWVVGQTWIALLIGATTFVGLTFLRVNYALALTFLATILSPIAAIGPLIALIPAVAIAFVQKPILGLWVFLFYNTLQFLKDDIIVPRLMGNVLGLNAIGILLAIFIGASLFGLLGAVVSVPTAAGIVVVFDSLRPKR